MKRVVAKLVPKDLNFLQKERRVDVAKEMLANVADDPTFIKHIIAGDEMRVYEYDVETAQQSSEWRAKNEPIPKKSRKSRPKSRSCSSFFSITVVWFIINSFQRVKRSIRNTTWPFWGVYVKQFVVNGRICGQPTHKFFTTIMRRHIPACSWLNFWLNTKQKSLLSHCIRQIWLPMTFYCFQNSNICSGERAMSRLRP